MGFGLIITQGDGKVPLGDDYMRWLVEARVEMELSKPSRFAVRFEDDICEGEHEIAKPKAFEKSKIGVFVKADDKWECLVFGPVTKIRSSSLLGGPGSWVEVHGEDRRVEMSRVEVQATYPDKDSDAAKAILEAHGFNADTEPTIIKREKKYPVTQNTTDLAFLEDVARRNNMELWLDYKVESMAPNGAKLTEFARLKTSPSRNQSGTPAIPLLKPDTKKILKIDPPPGDCANITKFDTRIDFEKPTAAFGFLRNPEGDKKIIKSKVEQAEPVDPDKTIKKFGDRKVIPRPDGRTNEELFLAQEAIVFEQSWFVEVDCSATLEQLNFVVRPHQIVSVAHAGKALSGGYQVLKATHVATATDHFMDFTIRANGLGDAA